MDDRQNSLSFFLKLIYCIGFNVVLAWNSLLCADGAVKNLLTHTHTHTHTLPAIPGTNKHTRTGVTSSLWLTCQPIALVLVTDKDPVPYFKIYSYSHPTLLHGGSAVGRWTCDLQVAGLVPGRSAFM